MAILADSHPTHMHMTGVCAQNCGMQAYNKGSWQAADCLFSIRTRLAVSDVQSVSSDQSGKAAGSSLPSQSDTKPKSVLAPAFVPDQVRLVS